MNTDLHNKCLQAHKLLAVRHPDLLRPRGVALEIGTPEHTFMIERMSLDAVAGSLVCGDRPRKSDLKRANAVIARLL